MSDLFSASVPQTKTTDVKRSQFEPLAHRLRPQTLEAFFGQAHLLSDGKLLKRLIVSDRISSLIFYGPPGSGKTTLAHIIAAATKAHYRSLNAVSSNVQELRRVIDEARQYKKINQAVRTILFVDEIHRFNKAQQDVLMPDIENGTVILIGSTTQNPSFTVNSPLLSRSHVFEFKPLDDAAMKQIIENALHDKDRGLGTFKIMMTEGAVQHLIKHALGDARRVLNALEVGVLTTPPDAEGLIQFDEQVAAESCQKKIVYYDDGGDYHYDTASVFIKSMRGSDPDAAVYWLAKMLHAGEDPRFIARRIVILASEDIGNADPQALILASSGLNAIEFVGMPEARIILSQLVTYMALAPKSNASYEAIESATQDVQNESIEEVPTHLRDSHGKVSKQLGRGKDYLYAHHFQEGIVNQSYRESHHTYYHPKAIGFEKTLQERIAYIQRLKSQKSSSHAS
ncbi:MAG: hypothetical protein COV74_01465 [Candidatus Omnitrophica bacterium CG11_big_fil_rev_8_21_14_0_20_45_26]|uniref:Replication-associated recombination protein A n=1 Tax=Candidatus Abzuiibacterium crystallinum TaxID=1974748 RepID=A0A2H0LS91_9BACT|nr:MAG: hypothetical protein COV74_01465 [Candidatus Omnitrophica bacterium CG11_big_fil_rev_8_21_14_0_20_45_26]PIW64966.1 MAG: hypothetical protein COW12_03745 [Candidatus Omnitrophica bacterium CG12_big_fil_rev_8_21_14_0_65_45_16]